MDSFKKPDAYKNTQSSTIVEIKQSYFKNVLDELINQINSYFPFLL